MPARTLNLAQRIVMVIGLGIGLDVFGQWLVSRGTGATRWVAYAPLTSGGTHRSEAFTRGCGWWCGSSSPRCG